MLRRLAVSTMVAALVAGTAIVPTDAQGGDGRLDAAISYREAHGLNSNADYVARSLSDESSFPIADWPVPMTPNEDAELNRRLHVQQQLGDAIAYAARQDDFGGWYIDHRDSGNPVFLFTSAIVDHREALAARLPGDVTFRVEKVASTYDKLLDDKQEFIAAIPRIQSRDVSVVSVAVDPRGNRLMVGIDGSLAEARQGLGDRWDSVGLRADTVGTFDCSMTDCDPHKAGLKISTNVACTIAFAAEKANGDKIAITAGHCNQFGGTSVWKHDGVTIGDVGVETFPASGVTGIADAGIISNLTNYWTPDAWNKIVSTNENPLQAYRVTSVTIPVNQAQGVNVCRTGWGWYGATGDPRKCGEIHLLDQFRSSCSGTTCRTIDHQWEVDFDGVGGDSGGPMYSKPASPGDAVSAFGIHVHSDPDNDPDPHGWYSPLYYVTLAFASLGSPVTIDHYCTTTNC